MVKLLASMLAGVVLQTLPIPPPATPADKSVNPAGRWIVKTVDSSNPEYTKKTSDELKTAELELKLAGDEISGAYIVGENRYELNKSSMTGNRVRLVAPKRSIEFDLEVTKDLLKGYAMDLQNGKAYVRLSLERKKQ